MVAGLFVAGLILCGCGSGPGSTPASAAAGQPPASQPDADGLDRSVRVLLLDKLQTASLTLAESFKLIDPASGETLRPAEPAGELAVTFNAEHVDFASLDYSTDREIVDLVPSGDKPFQVKLEDEWQEFVGTLRFHRRPDGGAVILLLDIEDYLVGVVASELPASFAREAFRAQAIACRTYAWYARQTTGLKRDWDVWASEKSQVYRGLERQRLVPQALSAVRDTRGIVCTWSSPRGEKIFCTYYSSRCGGITAAAGAGREGPIPPLAGGVACAFCQRPDAYQWPAEPRLAKTLIAQRLKARYARFAALGQIEGAQVLEQSPDGRALRIAITDEAGQTAEMDAESFRLTVDPGGRLIQSTHFTLLDEGGELVVMAGRGMGHGMGMCQYGAQGLAQSSWDAGSILHHYFPGARLTRAY